MHMFLEKKNILLLNKKPDTDLKFISFDKKRLKHAVENTVSR